MESKWYKELWRGASGLLVLILSAMALIGGTGYLLYDGHYIFAFAVVVVCCFAFKPVKEYVIKTLFT